MFKGKLIDVGNGKAFLVDKLYIHKSCIEINVHEVCRSRNRLTPFITTLWVKPSLNGAPHEVMDDDGNRYQVLNVVSSQEVEILLNT